MKRQAILLILFATLIQGCEKAGEPVPTRIAIPTAMAIPANTPTATEALTATAEPAPRLSLMLLSANCHPAEVIFWGELLLPYMEEMVDDAVSLYASESLEWIRVSIRANNRVLTLKALAIPPCASALHARAIEMAELYAKSAQALLDGDLDGSIAFYEEAHAILHEINMLFQVLAQ